MALKFFYNKTKDRPDEATTFPYILRAPTYNLTWAGKAVKEGLKAIAVNSFLSWRIRNMKNNAKEREVDAWLNGLENFRNSLNVQSSLRDQVVDTQVLVYGKKLQKCGSTVAAAVLFDRTSSYPSESRRMELKLYASNIWRNRITFYTSPDVCSHVQHEYDDMCGMGQNAKTQVTCEFRLSIPSRTLDEIVRRWYALCV